MKDYEILRSRKAIFFLESFQIIILCKVNARYCQSQGFWTKFFKNRGEKLNEIYFRNNNHIDSFDFFNFFPKRNAAIANIMYKEIIKIICSGLCVASK